MPPFGPKLRCQPLYRRDKDAPASQLQLAGSVDGQDKGRDEILFAALRDENRSGQPDMGAIQAVIRRIVISCSNCTCRVTLAFRPCPLCPLIGCSAS